MRERKIDRPFLVVVILLVFVGFFIFSSASLGLLARDGARFGAIAFNQTVFGLIFGLIATFTASKLNYKLWRRHAFYIFLLSTILNLLLFVPGLGFNYGGATRWLSIGVFSFQPSELLKIGFIIYFAAWLSGVREKIVQFRYGMMPLLILFVIIGTILLAQPDTDTFLIIFIAGLAMFISEGGRWRDILIFGIITGILLSVIAFARPYVMERILTFADPSRDPLGSGYQIQQSLIAIGSGGAFGRGFGQSIQKFNFLPEPIGDSIFAVAAEEFGFLGSVLLILLFLFFAIRGLRIAARAPDTFSRLLVVGIVILIVAQSLVNMGAMLGLLPLSGMPLLFVSHGGTALFFTLLEVGIIFNISKYQRL